jgi:hypothetical protein
MKFALIIISLYSFSCLGQTNAQVDAEPSIAPKSDFQIDWKYRAGPYLIFDCERNHYACVDTFGNSNCQEERNFAIGKKLISYPCAPLKKFDDKKACVEKTYQIMGRNALHRFCYPKKQF